MQVGQRKLLMVGLVGAFVIQTGLVYSDDTPDRFEPLSPLAQEGRTLYHEHNCFTCHQIYGFGGFLGPDLTNVTARVDRERLDQILTVGSGEGLQMPAFHFSKRQIDAIEAYLQSVDRTGTGQARMSPPPSPLAIDAAITEVAGDHPMSAAAARGNTIFKTSACIGCHRVLYVNNIGLASAADLSRATTRLDDAEIDEVLEKGRVALGMPPSGLPKEQRADLIAWMHWLQTHRTKLQAQLGPAQERSIPWWEFGPATPETRSAEGVDK